ncbi:AAA-like domain-containing protein [Scytonema sp. PRP1]|uniref:AAA-like domain-containing protein n=1 Tax=Scytonema sp. PRP1 TaxID=3120513 RepID=UPI002FCF9B3C
MPACYVDRPPIEDDCYQEILRNGGLIRIKAPQGMGKKRLMYRVIDYVEKHNYQTCVLDIQLAGSENLIDTHKFLSWFCVALGKELELSKPLNTDYETNLAPLYKTTDYLKYVLTEFSKPFVLALLNIDLVFEQTKISADICSLLRSWNQKAEAGYDKKFQKLRLIIVHSTEVYGTFDINKSPLHNVGLTVEPKEFNLEQVRCLVKAYCLSWNDTQIKELMDLVGGHPVLVIKAIEQISKGRVTLKKLLNTAHTEAELYGDHLRQHLFQLEENSQLLDAIKKVIISVSPVNLETSIRFKLHRMGLVNLQGNRVTIRCQLYKKYLCDCFGVSE